MPSLSRTPFHPRRIALSASILVLGCGLAATAGADPFILNNEQTYATLKGAYDVEVRDLDGDGKPEILAALFDHEWVAVLHNDGTGHFPAGIAQYPSNENSAIEVADMDGDGKLDFATANYNVSSVSFRRGTGQATFLAKTNYNTSAHPRDLVSADLDGDGFVDLAVACETGAITIVHNRGALGFDPATTTFMVGGSLRSIGAADLDHDGKVDLVVLDRAGGRVVPLRNLGGLAFSPGTPIAVPTSANGVLVRDLSQDGWADLAIAMGDGNPYADGSMRVVLNAGNGGFLAPRDYADVPFSQSITAADFDGDGILDLLTSCETQGSVRVTLGKGGGVFGGAVQGSANGPVCAAAGDVNGDGRVDVVTGNYIAGNLNVVFNRRNLAAGPFHWSQVATIACDVGGYDAAVGDLDRDGHPDVVGAIVNGNEVEVFRNLGDGTGRLAYPVRYPGGQAVAVDAGDYTGDGWPDVASVNFAQGTMSLRANLGDGTLGPAADVTVGTKPRCIAGGDFDGDGRRDLVIGTTGGLVLTRQGTPTGLGPVVQQFAISAAFKGVSIGDLDGDGRPDIALADSAGHKVFILHNDDGAHFSFALQLSLSNKTSDVVVADLDGDGDRDLGVSNEDGFAQVCPNDGTGHFPAARPFAIGQLAQTIVAADLDGNGLPELVVPYYYPQYDVSRVQALVNVGDGYFSGNQLGVAGRFPRAAVCADFDGDGRVDVATMDYLGGSLHVLRNLPGVGPPAADPFPCDGPRFVPPSSPMQAIALDVDGNGRADLATTGDGLLSIYRDGADGPHQDLATGANPQSLAAGDLDGDGRPELVVANLDENSVSVYRNGPGGVFAPLATLPVGRAPRFVAVADLDRDGRLDLATANEGDATHAPTVTILFNPPGATWSAIPEPVDAEAPAPDPPAVTPGGIPVTSPGRIDLEAPGGAVMLVAGDLNGDGATDLVVNQPGAHDIAIWYQTTPGRFAAPIQRPAGGSAWTAIGDLDGDGKPELAIADPDLDLLRILWNASSDPFTAESDIPVFEDPRSVALGDFTHDGVPDVAYVSSAQGWFGFYQTFPFHDFREWSRCIAGGGARTIALAPDVFDPGALDAFVVNGDDGTIFQSVVSPFDARVSDAEATGSVGSPLVFALGHPQPNPAVANSMIAFSLPQRGPAHLGVYDVRGRLVRTLVHGTVEAGAHQAAWDGTNEAGSRVGAGVYFCRLRSAAGAKVERLVRL